MRSTSSMPIVRPGRRQRPRRTGPGPAASMAGERPGSGREVTKRTSTASAPDQTNTARSADTGPAGLGQRAHDQGGRLVRAEEGGHPLGVGLAHDPVVGGRAWRSPRPCAPRRNHANGWAAATVVNGRHQLAQGPAVGGGVVARPARPARSRTAGTRAPGPAVPMAVSAGPNPGQGVAHHRVRVEVDRALVAGQPLRPAGPGGPDGLGPGDQRHRQVAGGDLGCGPVDQPLRRVAPDGGHLAAHVGPEAQPVGELGGRGRARPWS